MTFTCGHDANEPRNMGRGQARIKRLAEYFNRPCLSCASARLIDRMSELTDPRGNPRPATPEQVNVRITALKSRYWG
jgi:hypothetical protein